MGGKRHVTKYTEEFKNHLLLAVDSNQAISHTALGVVFTKYTAWLVNKYHNPNSPKYC
ncbi:hypothetical protein [Piscirickettsia salmonis]|uniref:hypothetical protein n=1 Tax=Piscirickettsia salmonis TaxID=1238 RepID=UPI00143DC659|nr:hypothetical protein [Piscirickettsia salmonis]QIX57543.1 hypothetical protein GW536_19555 [Piscirickettsia salmonis]